LEEARWSLRQIQKIGWRREEFHIFKQTIEPVEAL